MGKVNPDDYTDQPIKPVSPAAGPAQPPAPDNYQNPLKTFLPDLGENLKGIPMGVASTAVMMGKDIWGGGKALIYGGAPKSQTEEMIKSIPKVYAAKYWGEQPKPTGDFALDVYNALMPKRAVKEFTQRPVSTLLDISAVAGGGASLAGVAEKGAQIAGAAQAAAKAARIGSVLGDVEAATNVPGRLANAAFGFTRGVAEGTGLVDMSKVKAFKDAGETGRLNFNELGTIIKTTDKKTLYLKTMSDNLDALRKTARGDMPASKIAENQSGYLVEAQNAMDKLEKEYYNDAYAQAHKAEYTNLQQTDKKSIIPKFTPATEIKITLPSTINKIDDLLAYEKAKGTALTNKKAVSFLEDFKKDLSGNMTYDKTQSIQNALQKIDWADADAAELTGYKRQLWGVMKSERVDQLDKLAPGFKTKLQAADAVFKAHQSEVVNDVVKSFDKLIKEKDFKGAMAHIVDPTMDPELANMVKNRMGGKVDAAKAYIMNDIAERATVDGVVNYNKLRNGINRWSGIADVYFNPAELAKIKGLEDTVKIIKVYENQPNGKMLYRRAFLGLIGEQPFLNTPQGQSFLEQAVHGYKYTKQIAPSERKKLKQTIPGITDE